MGKTPLTKDSEFVVGEDKVLVYIMALLCLAVFVYGWIDAILKHFNKMDILSFVFILALLPAFLFFRKAKSKRIYIRINKTGIYQNEQLVTDWSKFLKAYISQKEKVRFRDNLSDNFILVVEYLKDSSEKGFRRSIPLTNTQNKSEEEVLEAVKFFWKEYQKDAGR